MSTAAAPIMVRANITRDEWANLRKLAIDKRKTSADLIAEALRAAYNLNGEPSK